jgi:hypothetical protein
LPQSVATTGRSKGDRDIDSEAGDGAGGGKPIVVELVIIRVVVFSVLAAVGFVVRDAVVGDNEGDSAGVVNPPFVALLLKQGVSVVAISDSGAGMAEAGSFLSISTGYTAVPWSSLISRKSHGDGNNEGDAGDGAGADDTVLVETVHGVSISIFSALAVVTVREGASNIGYGWFSVLSMRPGTLPRFAPTGRGKGDVDADDSNSVTLAFTHVVFVSPIAVAVVNT